MSSGESSYDLRDRRLENVRSERRFDGLECPGVRAKYVQCGPGRSSTVQVSMAFSRILFLGALQDMILI
jgi:hypothetical protein